MQWGGRCDYKPEVIKDLPVEERIENGKKQRNFENS
jgi:hypothetical protein